MRKFILFLTGGLIILSILFIFVNNFIEREITVYMKVSKVIFIKKTLFFIYQVKSLKLKK